MRMELQIKMGAMSTKRARKAINFPRSEKQSANGRENVGIAKMREVRQNLKIASKAATALVAEEVAKAVTRELLEAEERGIAVPLSRRRDVGHLLGPGHLHRHRRLSGVTGGTVRAVVGYDRYRHHVRVRHPCGGGTDVVIAVAVVTIGVEAEAEATIAAVVEAEAEVMVEAGAGAMVEAGAGAGAEAMVEVGAAAAAAAAALVGV